MQKLTTLIGCFGSLLLAPISLMAKGSDGLNLNAGLMMIDHTKSYESGNTEIREKRAYDFSTFGATYVMSGFSFGLKYVLGAQADITVEETDSSETKTTLKSTWSGIGPALGFSFDGGPEFLATYLFSGQRVMTTNIKIGGTTGESKATYSDGTAWAVDAAWPFRFKSVAFGPKISFIHFDYQKVTVDDTKSDLNDDDADDFIMPSFGFWLYLQ